MRNAARIHAVTLGLLVGLAGRASGQAKTAAIANPTNTAVSVKPPRNDSLYSGLERDFRVGKTIYLRSSKTPIGVIRATGSNHSFPPKFPAPRMKAVLIRHTDGPVDWVPLESAVRIYVVNKQ